MTSPDTRAGHRAAEAAAPAAPAVPEPTGAPPAVLPALLVGLVGLGLGVVAVRDAVVSAGWASGSAWAAPVLDALNAGVDRSPVVAVVGVVVALVGLWMLVRSVGRRPHTDVSMGAGTRAWIPPQHVARVASVTAADVDGVVSVRVSGSRRRVAVRVVATDTAIAAVREAVTAAVEQAVAGLDPTPRVTVRVSTLGGSQ